MNFWVLPPPPHPPLFIYQDQDFLSSLKAYSSRLNWKSHHMTCRVIVLFYNSVKYESGNRSLTAGKYHNQNSWFGLSGILFSVLFYFFFSFFFLPVDPWIYSSSAPHGLMSIEVFAAWMMFSDFILYANFKIKFYLISDCYIFSCCCCCCFLSEFITEKDNKLFKYVMTVCLSVFFRLVSIFFFYFIVQM